MEQNEQSSRQDAISLLKEDHRRVQALFEEFENVKDDLEACQDIVNAALAELMVHTRLEEEIFYPEVRDALQADDLLNEAEVEHGVAGDLIDQMLAMPPEDELYSATFRVLGEYVGHHIREEQNELFPKVKKSDLDLQEMGQRLMRRKQELEDELLEGGDAASPQQPQQPGERP